VAVVADDTGREVLRELRNSRRRHYLKQLDWVDALYKAYLTAIGAGAGTLLLSGVLGDHRASAAGVHDLVARGPAILGLGVALLIAAGLRTGSRGGPLALQRPDVHQVLLAPIDRRLALRGPAIAQLRSRAFVAGVAGAVVGNLAFRRLPGKPAAWVACGLAFAVLAVAAGMGAALVASGRRIRPLAAGAIGLALLGWSVADWLLHVTSSPATMLGELALAPVARPPLLEAAAGGALALVLLAAGLVSLGGTSLEASLRRAGLVAQLRFAVTVQDLRTVILLRRQLAAELPRSRPWLRLRAGAGKATLGAAVWRRGWHSFLRWPAARVARVLVLGAVAAASLVGTWHGTTPLVIVAGCALLLIALDAIEPLAQEIDHPTRRALVPIRTRALLRPHLVAPGVVLALACLAAVAGALAATADVEALEVGLAVVIPASMAALAGAAVSVITDPFQWVLLPVAQNVRAGAPFLLAIAGVAPVLVARVAARHGLSPVGAAIQTGIFVTLLSVGVLLVLTGRLAPKDAA
jgi:hypothetical protein